MQIVSLGDILHEMANPIFWEKMRKIPPLSSAELDHIVLSFKLRPGHSWEFRPTLTSRPKKDSK